MKENAASLQRTWMIDIAVPVDLEGVAEFSLRPVFSWIVLLSSE